MNSLPEEILAEVVKTFLLPSGYKCGGYLDGKPMGERVMEVCRMLKGIEISGMVRRSPRFQWNQRMMNRYCACTPDRPTMRILRILDRCGVDPLLSPMLLPIADSIRRKGSILYMGNDMFYIYIMDEMITTSS